MPAEDSKKLKAFERKALTKIRERIKSLTFDGVDTKIIEKTLLFNRGGETLEGAKDLLEHKKGEFLAHLSSLTSLTDLPSEEESIVENQDILANFSIIVAPDIIIPVYVFGDEKTIREVLKFEDFQDPVRLRQIIESLIANYLLNRFLPQKHKNTSLFEIFNEAYKEKTKSTEEYAFLNNFLKEEREIVASETLDQVAPLLYDLIGSDELTGRRVLRRIIEKRPEFANKITHQGATFVNNLNPANKESLKFIVYLAGKIDPLQFSDTISHYLHWIDGEIRIIDYKTDRGTFKNGFQFQILRKRGQIRGQTSPLATFIKRAVDSNGSAGSVIALVSFCRGFCKMYRNPNSLSEEQKSKAMFVINSLVRQEGGSKECYSVLEGLQYALNLMEKDVMKYQFSKEALEQSRKILRETIKIAHDHYQAKTFDELKEEAEKDDIIVDRELIEKEKENQSKTTKTDFERNFSLDPRIAKMKEKQKQKGTYKKPAEITPKKQKELDESIITVQDIESGGEKIDKFLKTQQAILESFEHKKRRNILNQARKVRRVCKSINQEILNEEMGRLRTAGSENLSEKFLKPEIYGGLGIDIIQVKSGVKGVVKFKVLKVFSESPAYFAGLKEGDEIEYNNSKEQKKLAEIITKLRTDGLSLPVVKVKRKGKEVMLKTEAMPVLLQSDSKGMIAPVRAKRKGVPARLRTGLGKISSHLIPGSGRRRRITARIS